LVHRPVFLSSSAMAAKLSQEQTNASRICKPHHISS
jgi:hypothetical protein